nr:hypothetical protein [Tanacetum cinerariifolium]
LCASEREDVKFNWKLTEREVKHCENVLDAELVKLHTECNLQKTFLHNDPLILAVAKARDGLGEAKSKLHMEVVCLSDANVRDFNDILGGETKLKPAHLAFSDLYLHAAVLTVSCYTDAGYLTDADDLKSQTGYAFVLNGGAVDWKTNESGITKGARHFRAKVHHLREVIEYGDIKLEKVHTDDNLADPFTKTLAFSKHSEHTRNIGMLPASSLIAPREQRTITGKASTNAAAYETHPGESYNAQRTPLTLDREGMTMGSQTVRRRTQPLYTRERWKE